MFTPWASVLPDQRALPTGVARLAGILAKEFRVRLNGWACVLVQLNLEVPAIRVSASA
jgi:hypothetical protein